MTDELIRKSDALAACRYDDAHDCRDAIAALPAVVVGVTSEDIDALAYRFWSIHPKDIPDPVGMPERYKGGALAWFYATEIRRILAALTPTAVDASQPADPAVNAPDYTLTPHLQRIVEGAKTAPQWDTVSDRMAAHDLTEYERKVAQMKEDFPNGI